MKLTYAFVCLAGLVPACAFNSYLNQMGGGGAATMKPATFAPGGGGKPKAPPGGPASYLDNIAGGSAATAPPPPPPPAPEAPPAAAAPPAAPAAPAAADSGAAAPAVGDYLSSLKVSSTAGGSGPAGYLDALRTHSEAGGGPGPQGYLSTLKVESATGGGGISGYLEAIGGGGSAVKASSYAPGKSYAATKGAASGAPSSGGDTMIAQEPVLRAINQLNDNMVKNQEATIGVLYDINTSVKTLVEKSI